MILSNQPTPIQAGDATIYLTGLLMYREEPAGEASALAFLEDFDRGTARFDDCTGPYRVRIVYPDGREVYFGDNAAIMRWYIGPKGFRTSLREAAPDGRTPNESGIIQFLSYGFICGPETVVREVRRSDPGKYYVVKNGQIEEKEKNLTPLEELDVPEDELARQMRRFSKAVAGREDVVCTITGGVDSRVLLSHMIHNGLRPRLDITGKPTDADVVIAKKIAERLEAELLFVEETPEGENWIDEAIREADGMIGVCGIYRLYKKAAVLQKEGIALECGGFNGEMYKNYFLEQDYPFYGGKPNWERYLRNKIYPYDFPTGVYGPRLTGTLKKVPEATLKWLRTCTGKTKASSYLTAGHYEFQGMGGAVLAMNARYYIPYTPFMERNVAAPALRRNPYTMEMEAFHREQVSTYCPAIKDIETNHGVTCNDRAKSAIYVKNMGVRLLINTPLWQNIRRGKEMKGRVDACFREGLSSPQYQAALARCKKLGIIASDVADLPAGIADRVFALGTIL